MNVRIFHFNRNSLKQARTTRTSQSPTAYLNPLLCIVRSKMARTRALVCALALAAFVLLAAPAGARAQFDGDDTVVAAAINLYDNTTCYGNSISAVFLADVCRYNSDDDIWEYNTIDGADVDYCTCGDDTTCDDCTCVTMVLDECPDGATFAVESLVTSEDLMAMVEEALPVVTFFNGEECDVSAHDTVGGFIQLDCFLGDGESNYAQFRCDGSNVERRECSSTGCDGCSGDYTDITNFVDCEEEDDYTMSQVMCLTAEDFESDAESDADGSAASSLAAHVALAFAAVVALVAAMF